MVSSSKRAKQVWSLVAVIIVVVAVIVALVLIGNLVFKNQEQRISSNEGQTVVRSMDCVAKQPQDAFFQDELATEAEHEIKVTYRNNDANKISYVYDGEYATFNDAEDAEAKLHADYNIYMKDLADSFSPNFSVIEDELKVSLFADAYDLGSATARMFFITPEEFENMEDYNIDDLKQIYESKGFQCEFDD